MTTVEITTLKYLRMKNQNKIFPRFKMERNNQWQSIPITERRLKILTFNSTRVNTSTNKREIFSKSFQFMLINILRAAQSVLKLQNPVYRLKWIHVTNYKHSQNFTPLSFNFHTQRINFFASAVLQSTWRRCACKIREITFVLCSDMQERIWKNYAWLQTLLAVSR